MRAQSLGVMVLAVFSFIGCSAVYTAYPSENGQQKSLTANTQGTALVNANDSHIWIVSVDGEREGVPSHGRYQFLPGRHTVRVQYYWSHSYVAWTGNDLADYSFNVKTGATLRVVCQHTEEPGYSSNYSYKGTWKFWIADAVNGDVITTEDSGPIVTREATGEKIEPEFIFLRIGKLQ